MIEGQEDFIGNEKHLKVLLKASEKKDISIWNNYVAEQGEGFVAYLVRASLNNAILTKANLNGAWLNNAKLDGTVLWEAELNKAQLFGAELNGAILRKTELNGADLRWTKLNKTDLRQAKLNGADLRGAKLKEVLLMFAEVNGARLEGANFEQTNVAGVAYNKQKRKMHCEGIRIESAYGSPMFKRFVQDKAFLEEFREKSIKHKIIYWIWLIFADCGRTIWNWLAWSVGFMLLFTTIYNYGPAVFEQTTEAMHNHPMDFWSCLYFSIVKFTTLGFGDIVAANTAARIWVSIEVIIGYVMLGGLISIFATKLARRS